MSNLSYLIKLLQLFPACFIYTPFVTLSPFVALSNFCRLIKLLSSYRTFVIFSPLVIYSFFTLSAHPINAPAEHTTITTLSPVLSCARSLRQYIFLTHQASLVIVPFWYGGIEAWLGVFSKSNLLPSPLWVMSGLLFYKRYSSAYHTNRKWSWLDQLLAMKFFLPS